jgi:glycolate oxidase FAD binding subunit
LRYGALRDLIIGMTIVLADGTIAHTGGKVVKNVAGYDLHKLMIGSFGTLGIVTSINFRLHSLPKCTRSFSISALTVGPLGSLMMKLLHGQLSTVAVQIRGTVEGFVLDAKLASLAEVVESQAAVFEALARGEGLTSAPADDAVWQARQHLMDRDFVVKATMLPTDVARFAERIHAEGGESVTQATGIMFAGLPAGAADGLKALRRDLEEAHGTLMVLSQPGSALDCWGTLPDSFPLMREIKRQFDPDGVLNPGRFLGHI